MFLALQGAPHILQQLPGFLLDGTAASGELRLTADSRRFIRTRIVGGQHLAHVQIDSMGTSRWPSLSPDVVARRVWNVLSVNWLLGFTAFGGPPVHFKIVRTLSAATSAGFESAQLIRPSPPVPRQVCGQAQMDQRPGGKLCHPTASLRG